MADATDGAQRRSAKNYLLAPRLQLLLGLYSALLGVAFAFAVLGIIFAGMSRVYVQVMDLVAEKAAALEIIDRAAHDCGVYLFVAALLFVVMNIVVTIVYTHRLVGPMHAFERQLSALREGRYDARVALRPHDAFQEVATELNGLASDLQARASGSGAPPSSPAPPPAA
jgi:methyl-accepting chemotaxis protein